MVQQRQGLRVHPPEGGGEDLFAHFSSVQMDGYKTLKAGQSVQFDVQAGPKGLHAVNIRALATSEPQVIMPGEDEDDDGSDFPTDHIADNG